MAKNRTEKFNKKSEETKGGKKVITITKVVTQEEDFVLTLEKIQELEGNAQAFINQAEATITEMNAKLEEYKKLRELLKIN